MSTRQTFKFTLTLAVGFLAMPAGGASARTVARIDQHHGNTSDLGLVFHEQPELRKGPSAQLRSLPLAKLYPVAYPLEILKADAALRVFCLNNEFLGDAVIHIFAIATLFDTQSDRCPMTTAPLRAVCVLRFLADGPALREADDPLRFDLVGRMHLAVRVDGDVCGPKVNADEVCDRRWRAVRRFNRDQQKPFSILAEYKVALAFGPAEPLTLVGSHHIGNDDTAFQGRDADSIRPFEADVLVHAEGNASVFSEVRTFLFVALVAFDDLSQATDGGVCGQAETLAYLSIEEFLQDEFVGDLSRVRFTGQPLSGFVESLDRRSQLFGSVGVWKQLCLQSQFHYGIVLVYSAKGKGVATIHPSLESDGPLAEIGRWVLKRDENTSPPRDKRIIL